MSNKLSVLMTVYDEASFIDYAIRACLPHVDHLVIVEGAYQETIKLGSSPRSTDGTCEIIKKYINDPKVVAVEVNEPSDKDQRNVGLKKIKELNPDGWVLIIDGDEIYEKSALDMVKVLANTLDRQNRKGAIFKSLTFVNDLLHYTEQYFPRLFKITSGCEFVNDNYMRWEDVDWFSPYIVKIPYVQYCHFAFTKGLERFILKKKWWESRFDKPFEYDWYIDKNGQLYSPNHKLFEFTGTYPEIIKDHPLYKQSHGEL